MPAGTTISAAKQLLVDAIARRVGQTGNVQYTRPTDGQDLQAPDGSSSVVYLDSEINVDYEILVMTAGVLRIDERYTIPVVVQVQALNGETQEQCDELVDELLHGVLGAIAQAPDLDWADTTELQMFVATPSNGSRIADAVGDSSAYFATRHIVNVEVRARLILS